MKRRLPLLLHCILHTSEGRMVAGHVDAVSIEAGGRLPLPHLPPSLRAETRPKASSPRAP